MNIQESLDLFKEAYPALVHEGTELDKRIVSIFENKLNEILPIVQVMKENRMFFFHPNLNNELKTSHGVIIGRNRDNNSVLYVYNGKYFVQKVDAYNDKVLEEAAMPLSNFFSYCDLDFAIKGIDYVKRYLGTFLESIEDELAKKKVFIENYG